MKKLLPFLVIAFVLSACLPNGMQVPQSPWLSTLERKSGLIAYIGADGNMYVVDQSGTNPQAITSDAVLPTSQSSPFKLYQLPTWSADGNQLAFIGVDREGNTRASDLSVYNVNDEQTTSIYTSQSEHPFYLYWSPDNENLSFLSTDTSGQNMLLQNVSTNGESERTILDAGSPYYWSWSPDGSVMIIHSGSTQSATPRHISFLQVKTDPIIEDSADVNPASFQAPAWSPDGSHILLSRINDEKRELILTNGTGTFEKSIAEFALNAAFAWSADSNMVAYIDGESQVQSGVTGKLHVLDLTTNEDFFQDENVVAFFWSPDSRKLAYFKPIEETIEGNTFTLLELHILDIVSGQSKYIFGNPIFPSNQFVALLPFFDQYHQSLTIWSPDSNNLAISIINNEGTNLIGIVAASGQLEPRLLAEGYLAVWSWK